jgi:hypothetical protein
MQVLRRKNLHKAEPLIAFDEGSTHLSICEYWVRRAQGIDVPTMHVDERRRWQLQHKKYPLTTDQTTPRKLHLRKVKQMEVATQLSI